MTEDTGVRYINVYDGVQSFVAWTGRHKSRAAADIAIRIHRGYDTPAYRLVVRPKPTAVRSGEVWK